MIPYNLFSVPNAVELEIYEKMLPDFTCLELLMGKRINYNKIDK